MRVRNRSQRVVYVSGARMRPNVTQAFDDERWLAWLSVSGNQQTAEDCLEIITPPAEPEAETEPLALTDVKGIGAKTATALEAAGIGTLEAIAALTDAEIEASGLPAATQTSLREDWRAQAIALLAPPETPAE